MSALSTHALATSSVPILRFFHGGADTLNRTHDEMLAFDFDRMEECHDWIQTAFPLHEESAFASVFPILSEEQAAVLAASPEAVSRMRRMLARMAAFYGLSSQDSPADNGAAAPGKNAPKRARGAAAAPAVAAADAAESGDAAAAISPGGAAGAVEDAPPAASPKEAEAAAAQLDAGAAAPAAAPTTPPVSPPSAPPSIAPAGADAPPAAAPAGVAVAAASADDAPVSPAGGAGSPLAAAGAVAAAPPAVQRYTHMNKRISLWCHTGDHNLLRITRIIRSLRLFGLEAEARAFYTAMTLASKSRLSDTTLTFWRRAMEEPVFAPLRRRY